LSITSGVQIQTPFHSTFEDQALIWLNTSLYQPRQSWARAVRAGSHIQKPGLGIAASLRSAAMPGPPGLPKAFSAPAQAPAPGGQRHSSALPSRFARPQCPHHPTGRKPGPRRRKRPRQRQRQEGGNKVGQARPIKRLGPSLANLRAAPGLAWDWRCSHIGPFQCPVPPITGGAARTRPFQQGTQQRF